MEHRFSDNRYLLIAQLTDLFVIKGAFDDPAGRGIDENVQEFCSRIMAIYRTPARSLARVNRLLDLPIAYRASRAERERLFSGPFLMQMAADIESELAEARRHGDEYDPAPRSETLGWRIAVMTALYVHCGSAWPPDAYRHACRAVAAASQESSQPPPTDLPAILCPPPRKMIDQAVDEEYRQAKRALRSRLMRSGVPPVLISDAIDNYLSLVSAPPRAGGRDRVGLFGSQGRKRENKVGARFGS